MIFFLPLLIIIMAKTKRVKKSQNKTRKTSGKHPGMGKSLLNFALIIPEKSMNVVFSLYLKFMKPFLKDVKKRLKGLSGRHSKRRRTHPTNVAMAINQTIKKPKFKKAWAKTVAEIFDVLFKPILVKSVQLLTKEGTMLAGAMAKIIGKMTLRSAGAVAGGLEGAMSAVPGVGTVLDMLQVVQGGLDAFGTLTVQSLKMATSMISLAMQLFGSTMGPLVKVIGNMKHLLPHVTLPTHLSLPGKSKSKTRRKRRRKGKSTSTKHITMGAES